MATPPLPQDFQSLLDRLAAGDQPMQDAMGDLIKSIYSPRFIRTSATAIVLGPEHQGAVFICTAAGLVTVTLSSGLGPGFMTSILPLGAGGATLSGTHVGGTTIAQNVLATAMTLDDSSWFVMGAA